MLDGFDDSTSLDDFEHYCGRFQETLDRLISLDDAFHDLLSDKYEEDVKNISTGRNGQSRKLVDVWTTICLLLLHE